MMSLLKNFNDGSITLRELANLAYDFKIINLKSPKMYEIIVDYFIKHGFTDVALINLGLRNSVNFIHAIFFCHPTLSNDAFFTVTRKFIMMNLDRFNKFQLIKLLDIYKYNQTFMNETQSQRLKALLENLLEGR
jgi:hypothetical protein